MATFPYAYRKVLVGSGDIRTTGFTKDLVPGQLGLFDAKTFKALSVAEATYSAHREVVLAQGSFHTKDVLSLGNGGLKESVKSRPIHGHFINNFRVARPQRALNHVIAVGYDGVDITKTISAKPDSDYFLRIDVKGEQVYRFMNRPIYYVFHVKTPCGPGPCGDNCDAVADPQFIADSLVEQINTHPWINPFVKAEKILSCNPAIPANPDNVAFNIFTLTLCDAGDGFALADIQSQYPNYSVSRIDRNASTSVYEICIPTSAGTPAAYAPDKARVIPNCTTCPTGFTFTDKLYKIEVTRPGSVAVGTIVTAYSGVSGYTLSTEYGVTKYVIYKSTPGVPAPAAAGDVVADAGFEVSVCVETATPGTIAWVDAGDRYKTVREMLLTVPKTCGGANRLTDVRNAYTGVASKIAGGTAGITIKTAGDCADIYTLKLYNDECLLDPCGGLDKPTFTNLQSFEGHVWEIAPVTPTTSDCAVGVRLTGAYIETKFGECSFYPTDHYELDAVRIYASQLLESGDRCEFGWPITELQVPKFASGTGEMVKRELITFMGYRHEDYFCDPRYRETLDTESWLSSIDRNKFYKIYYLTYNVPYTNNKTNLYNNEQYEVMVVFPETADTSAFETLLNSYVTSVGIQLTAI